MAFSYFHRSLCSSISLSRIHLASMLRPPSGLRSKPAPTVYTTILTPAAFSTVSAFSPYNRFLKPLTHKSVLASKAFKSYFCPGLVGYKSLAAPVLTCAGFPARDYFSTFQPPSEKLDGSGFTYGVSASYSSKYEALDLRKNTYSHNPHQRIVSTVTADNWDQRQELRPQSGQDAFFVADIGPPSSGNSIAFGVVDGVGGWEESGVDPADFAHGLCDYMAMASREYPASFGGESSAPYPLRPLDVLETGYQAVLSDARIQAGGSTACVGIANAAGELEVASLGDSGYAHLSPLRMNFMSDAQTHAFNTPFQLSKVPRRIVDQKSLFGGEPNIEDMPFDASITTRTLTHGDILIFGTDGVWDNLSASDILRITCQVVVALSGWIRTASGEIIVSPEFTELALRPGKGQYSISAVLAAIITREAKEASFNEKRDGPWALAAQRTRGYQNYRGGKVDDICTLVVAACQE